MKILYNIRELIHGYFISVFWLEDRNKAISHFKEIIKYRHKNFVLYEVTEDDNGCTVSERRIINVN